MPPTLFMPSFTYPLWLLVAPPLLFLVWRISKNSYAEGTPRRHRFWMILRSIIVLLLISGLAGLHWKTPVRKKQVLFLLDSSASLSTEQKQRALQWINQTVQKLKTPDQTGIVLFGAAASVEQFPGTPRMVERIESRVDDSQTNIQEGIRLTEALFAPGYQKNIVLLSDGNETNGNLMDAIADAQTRGINFQALYLQPGDHPEAAIEN